MIKERKHPEYKQSHACLLKTCRDQIDRSKKWHIRLHDLSPTSAFCPISNG